MSRNKPFLLQFIIVGGFLLFLYIFFALATAIYRDYKLEVNIAKFGNEIDSLADMANQKPKDVLYYQSLAFKDKYAKESLNLLNPGEKLIIIPQEEQIVKSEVVIDRLDNSDILKLPNRNQWWEYFFGHTLSLKVPEEPAIGTQDRTSPQPADKVDEEPAPDVQG